MIQLFQMREVERAYSSIRLSNTASLFYQNRTFTFINPETCEEINSYEDLEEQIDYYNYDDLNIEHRRSKPLIDDFSKSEKEAINNFRREYQNSPYLKKPTDIIIFTDSFSFSATSSLISGFQNIGGAIVVGYFGNPKLEGIDLFDASQSGSGVETLKDKKIGNMLFSTRVTLTEKFDDFYKKGNRIHQKVSIKSC